MDPSNQPESQPLHQLAAAIGLARQWWDVEGREQTVSDHSLAQIATALGYPAHNDAEIAASLAMAEAERREPPGMLVAEVGQPIPLPPSLAGAAITGADGTTTALDCSSWTLPPIHQPGYYDLTVNGHRLTLAIAPEHCPVVADLLPEHRRGERIWGVGVQIPALRAARPQPFGDFADLGEAVRLFAAHGADALAINPVHALFPGHGEGYAPYSPSSRIYFNTAMGDPVALGLPPLPAGNEADAGPFIDWEQALPRRFAQLRALFDSLDLDMRNRIAFENVSHGEGLVRQATFDALDRIYRPQGAQGWWDWPEEYRDPASEAVTRFAADHAEDIAFHMFLQWLARESMARAQAEARATGMAIGLVADLAVGVHTGGSDTWAMRADMLQGLTIGAPPDPLGPHGQNWMLTTFSPRGLARSGNAAWIHTLRSVLKLAGALRIDHAFGLARLWVVPEGEHSSAGAYLSYPFQDLVRLAALEAHLAGALIIAEDLGTAPHGFCATIEHDRMLGMRVLWFERAADQGFIGAQDYAVDAVAMTGTHDTATVAGWWTGADLDWAEKLGRLPAGTTRAEAEARRDWDRGLLWASLTGDAFPRPAPDDPAPVVEAALRHIGHAPSQLAIAPLEDILCEIEQPNLPGTIDEHPNWRRRLPAPLAKMLATPATMARIAALNEARKG